MFTKPLSTTELKQLFMECLLNTTSNVDKINNDSVLSGTSYGISKIAQKAWKEIALIEAHRFVDSAFGSHLDNIVEELGIAGRFEASISSTFLRLVGNPGTLYEQGTNICTGTHGVNFEFTEDITIGPHGYIYARVRSTSTGLNSNVDALSINKITPVPSGHSYLINEVQATGGRNLEPDDLFRKRIKESINIAATDTINKLEQVFMKINPDILRVFYQGVNDNGKNVLALVTQNGVDLTAQELNDLEDKSSLFLSISDLAPFGYNSIGIELINSSWEYVDVDMRVDLEIGFDVETVRKNIQVRMTKYLDFRFWDSAKRVEWDDLLNIAKTTSGVKAVSDTNFYPHTDLIIPNNKLPRLRSFIMRSLDGGIITDVSGYLQPVFYPAVADISYQRTILATII